MAFSAAQLATLEAAAATGELTVQLADRKIQYQTLADLLSAIDLARRDLAGTAALPVRRYMRYNRGD
jgi:hypothetical protein